jgi:23S rRNA (cytidine1920-2'-O)/16S rRNA (cytidine1409-2'-O)-methyltransferase
MASSRSAAASLVTTGGVTVRGIPTPKPASMVTADTPIEFVGEGPRYVGRGGLKLEGALAAFDLGVEGRRALDAGASTGGFTDHLLQSGVAHVTAVDVGRGQLDDRIAEDPRVTVRDRTNIRLASPDELGTFDLVVADLSFISLCTVADAFARLAEDGADLVLLVKPQFEVGKGQVGRGGIVKDPVLHVQALEKVIDCLDDVGLGVQAVCDSPITGAKGNREFFVWARKGDAAVPELALPVAAEVE